MPVADGLRDAPAGTLPFSRAQTHLRQLPGPLLSAQEEGAGENRHALWRAAHVMASSGSGHTAFAGRPPESAGARFLSRGHGTSLTRIFHTEFSPARSPPPSAVSLAGDPRPEKRSAPNPRRALSCAGDACGLDKKPRLGARIVPDVLFLKPTQCLIGWEKKKEPVCCFWYSRRGFYEPGCLLRAKRYETSGLRGHAQNAPVRQDCPPSLQVRSVLSPSFSRLPPIACRTNSTPFVEKRASIHPTGSASLKL